MRQTLYIISLFFCLFIIFNLCQSLYSLWQKQDLLVSAKKELYQEQKKNNKLKTQLDEVETPEFVEKEARNKLLYVKPGEKIVVFSDKLIVNEKETPTPTPPEPNWKQWLNLFIK